MKVIQVNMSLVDKQTKERTKEVDIKDIIYNQFDIEFEFENGGTLPYKDFLMCQDDYNVIISVKGENQ